MVPACGEISFSDFLGQANRKPQAFVEMILNSHTALKPWLQGIDDIKDMETKSILL